MIGQLLDILAAPLPGSVRGRVSKAEWIRALVLIPATYATVTPAVRAGFLVAGEPAGATVAPPLVALGVGVAATGGLLWRQRRQGMVVADPAATVPLVLVVEDDAGAARAMIRILGHYGWPTAHAATISQARALVMDRPRWVFLDLMVPGGDGEEILQLVRWHDLGCRVVVVSGVVDPDRIAAVKGMGVHGFEPKPFTKDRILAIVGRGPLSRHDASGGDTDSHAVIGGA